MNEEYKELEQFDLSLKKKKKKRNKNSENSENKDDNINDYDYVYLLDRIFSNLRENNPLLHSYKKLVIPPPQVIGLSSKKTMVCNFAEIVRIINRSIDHVQSYFIIELSTDCNIDSLNRIIIKGKFAQKHIESIFRKYITDYVVCNSCNKSDTNLIKDHLTRICFLKCNICKSTNSVQSLIRPK